MNSDILSNLNHSQRAAVTSVADTLAILAGPGSGKTHTLTSRTAWLLAQGLQPGNVIVATFTVKAALEMKERIGRLIGNGMESKLILGTFHSIARRYLAHYGHLIGIKKGFGIADASDSAAIIKRIVKRHEFAIEHKAARSRISSCKARGEGCQAVATTTSQTSVNAQEFEKVYAEYEEALKRSNMLDYDDLLLKCVELLRIHPSCVSNVEAVLIDEFQDTNIVQFDLMRLFAAKRKRITIVGDPDQSIYSFRAAEIKNYKRMLRQYPDTITIALEENYRSSGAILLSALNIIQQDTSRLDKSILPTHSVGTRPVLRKLASAHKEAEWIVMEIQRCLALTGDLLDLNDFAILVRSSSLSRLIESALAKSGISYRMVGGLRFYDRLEVKIVMDYLRVINQPSSNDALARIINTPSRRIGDATIRSLLEEADTCKITLWRLILDSVQGRRSLKTQIRKGQDQGLSELVNVILTSQKKMSVERLSIKGIMDYILEKLDVENWLKKQHSDENGARWDNIQELITQANDFEDLLSFGYEHDALPQIDGMDQTDNEDCLTKFLANVTLASEVNKNDGQAKPQLTISTIHAAKGLEWPVVFIPATYQGSIPHSRAEDMSEERRLLYVAMTRAKALLYMSCPRKNSQSETTLLSPFLTAPGAMKCLDQRGPSIVSSVVQSISQILRRGCPTSQAIHQSSCMLESLEDDRLPVDAEEKEDLDLKWNLTQGDQTFIRPPKRRKVEFGRSFSDYTELSTTHATTFNRASTFTTTASSGFVSAGQLSVFSDQSDNTIVEEASPEKSRKQVPRAKVTEGQRTLFNFLGKSDPQPPQPKLQQVDLSTNVVSHFNRPRVPMSNVSTTIDPLLANHCLRNMPSEKPRSLTLPRQPQNDYVFLSSSPPRQNSLPVNKEVTIPVKPAGLICKPTVFSMIRPPSMHMTTEDRMKTDGPKKALGMRGSVRGFQKGTKFKPPTMKGRQN